MYDSRNPANFSPATAAWQEALTCRLVTIYSGDRKLRKTAQMVLARAKRELKSKGYGEEQAFALVEACKAEASKRVDFLALHPNFGGTRA